MATNPNEASADKKPHRERKQDEQVHEVVFITYPKLLFAWPLIVLGVLFYFLPWPGPEALAWIYIATSTVVLLTMGVDVSRNETAFWIVLIAAIWVLGLWLQDAKGFTFFGDIYNWFANLDIQYNKHFGLVMSIFLGIPYGIMLVYARVNDKWRITHNEFEHYSLGRMDDSLGRGAKSIRTWFPDILELALGLAGTLIVYNATGTKELRRIPHVPFLPFVRKRLNRILERTAITSAMAAEAEEDEDDEN